MFWSVAATENAETCLFLSKLEDPKEQRKYGCHSSGICRGVCAKLSYKGSLRASFR